MGKCRCPYFLRKTYSYRYSGLKCQLYLSGRFSLGDGGTYSTTWDKEKRDKKIEDHCHGNFTECSLYKRYMEEKD